MGSDTTIPVSNETKNALEEDKPDGETWEAYLLRLANLDDNGKSLQEDVYIKRMDRIEDRLDEITESNADDLTERLDELSSRLDETQRQIDDIPSKLSRELPRLG